MDPETALVGTSLRRSFGEGDTKLEILHGVSLELCRGQMSVIMGPSGSGKTTLLAILSGLLHPDEGEVLALGHNLWQLTERQRQQFRLKNCGFIFQGHNLFPALTARQQLEIVLHWGEGRHGRKERQEVDAMLAKLDLTEKKRRLRPLELSGGEKQRVAIGRALIKKPALCFADEPTASLDWENGARVIDLLQRAAREDQAAIMVVTHDERITKYADRVYHLEDGKFTDSHPMQFSPAIEVSSVEGNVALRGLS
jgi:putative ABC transport system ATP-binding protein